MSRHLTPGQASRRAFLQRGGLLSLVGAAAPWALNLASMAEAAAQSSGAQGYKALVCVFLQGGNDHANTVLPYDPAEHQAYAQARGSIALTRESLAGTLLGGTPGGRPLAWAPALAPLHSLQTEGRLATLLNIGPLVQPTSLAQYRARSVPLPPKLFSHNDQQSVWQSSSPEGSTVGWGGNIGDLALSSNGNSLFTCISVTGNAVFLSGDSALQYQVSTNGAVAITTSMRRPRLSSKPLER